MEGRDWISLVIVVIYGVVFFLALLIYKPSLDAFYLGPDVFGALFIAIAIGMLEHSREVDKAVIRNPFAVMAQRDYWYYAGLVSMISTILGGLLAGFHIGGLIQIVLFFLSSIGVLAIFVLAGNLTLTSEVPSQRSQ
ncbi:MAG: hypothetical protein OK438_04405 [Thaumarchaeota archaeon]|nr:hypothetical protein [Nitrososphaerota archaeon]